MKKLFFLLPLMAMLFITSCNTSDPKNEQTISETLINKIQSSTSTEISSQLCDYVYNIDFNSMTASAVLPALRLKSGSQNSIKLEIRDMKVSASAKTGYTFTIGSNTAVYINGEKNSAYTISSFKGVVFDYEMSSSFVINTPEGNFTVNGYRKNQVYPETKAVITSQMGSPFSWNDANMVVGLSLESKGSSITLYQIKFAETMPNAMDNMKFDGLVLTPTISGYRLTSQSLIPTIAGTPYPNYAITDLVCDISGTTAYLTFKCMGVFNVTLTGNMHATD